MDGMARRLLCLHGHFYQPPRENPWIEAIEVQDTAEPFHDWNERIASECYGPNGSARIKGAEDRILDIANNYLHLSFNFGPTLLAWLERARPDTYARVVLADQQSLEARGEGNAIAQGYSHAILPLANARDRRTQVLWGVADFRRRFHRPPLGFWIPETAADTPTLAALVEAGIRFTVLSPYQAVRVRPPGGGWQDARGARFDPTRPYRVRVEGGELVVFFYDGHIARDLAFGDALGSPGKLIERLLGGFDGGRGHDEILTVAFDGETLGHHKKGGDEVLAAALRQLAGRSDVELVNLGQALRRVPAEWEAEIVEGASWSCAHGVERWRSDCGCNTGGGPGWRQAWRAPLRTALEWLRDRIDAIFEREGNGLFPDAWRVRDAYVELVLDPERREASEFLRQQAGRELSEQEEVRALSLLEMERQSLLMFTSCGWFFSEISGIETVQVLKYAARAIQLARDLVGLDLEQDLEARLALAPSNDPAVGDGRQVYQRLVKPSVVTLEGVAAHLAISSSVRDVADEGRMFCHAFRLEGRRTVQAGPISTALGRVRLEHLLTHERLDAIACVLHFGEADFRCGLTPYRGPEHEAEVETALLERSQSESLAHLLRETDRFFPGRDYGLRDLFLDERRRVADLLLQGTIQRYAAHYQEIFEDNRRLMEFLCEIDSPIPNPLRVAADVTLTRRLVHLTRAARAGELDLAAAEVEMEEVAALARRLGAHLHMPNIRREVGKLVTQNLQELLAGKPPARPAAMLARLVGLARRLGMELDLWEAQNKLWGWVGSSPLTIDREVAAELARNFWFDERTLLARAGYTA
jgi:alpha-amylase/alpha-mannosidase (GH57 family)